MNYTSIVRIVASSKNREAQEVAEIAAKKDAGEIPVKREEGDGYTEITFARAK